MRIIYYGTSHCGMCQALKPRVEQWCKENNFELEYHDAEDAKYADELKMHRIMSVPAIVMIDGDKACTIRGIDGWNTFVESWRNRNEN